VKTEDRLLAELPKVFESQCPEKDSPNALTTPRNLTVGMNFWGFSFLDKILILFHYISVA